MTFKKIPPRTKVQKKLIYFAAALPLIARRIIFDLTLLFTHDFWRVRVPMKQICPD
jgi:hypothetical protein